ncbi:hypothetical protein ACIGCM_06795 [Pseudomonas sp. NPDC078700]|uniref:hypothetical protein n=1 Tax=Pseudomonas sp. NPDC078700 TaxID=3364424 RepID=UPI0037CA64B7
MANTLYLQLMKNRMRLLHIESGKTIELAADSPISNNRLLVADFLATEALLKQAIAQLETKRWFQLQMPAQMVIQPLELIEGGLAPVEERILLELGHGSGARKVQIHVGEQLSPEAVLSLLR